MVNNFSKLCSASLLLLMMEPTPYKARRAKKRFNFRAFAKEIDDKLFYQAFRMDKESFADLLLLLIPYYKKHRGKKKRKMNLWFDYDCRLGAYLQYIAGARLVDIRIIYRPISLSAILGGIWETVDAINACFAAPFPTDLASLKKIEVSFRKKVGCVIGNAA